MKKLLGFITLAITFICGITSCKNGSYSENSMVTLKFGAVIDNSIAASRQMDLPQPIDYSTLDFILSGETAEGDTIEPVVCSLSGSYLYNKETEEQISFSVRSTFWTFDLKAVLPEDHETVLYKDSYSFMVNSETANSTINFRMKFNEEVSKEIKGDFIYTIIYPKDDSAVNESSLVYTITPTVNLTKTVEAVDETYYRVILSGEIPWGKYDLSLKLQGISTAGGNNDTFLKKEVDFFVYPFGTTTGYFDGMYMDLNNSYALTISAAENEFLNSITGLENFPIQDWYSKYEAIELPSFETDTVALTKWYYKTENDKDFIEIPEEGGKFIFNKNHDITGNVILSFECTANTGNLTVTLPEYPAQTSNSLIMTADYETNPDYFIFIARNFKDDSEQKFELTECKWYLDGKLLDLKTVSSKNLLYFADTSVFEDSIGTWEIREEDGLPALIIEKEQYKYLIELSIFASVEDVPVTCIAPLYDSEHEKVITYGSCTAYLDNYVLIKWPNEPVREKHDLSLQVVEKWTTDSNTEDPLKYGTTDPVNFTKIKITSPTPLASNAFEILLDDIRVQLGGWYSEYTGNITDDNYSTTISEVTPVVYPNEGFVVAEYEFKESENAAYFIIIENNIQEYLRIKGKYKAVLTFIARNYNFYDSINYEILAQ